MADILVAELTDMRGQTMQDYIEASRHAASLCDRPPPTAEAHRHARPHRTGPPRPPGGREGPAAAWSGRGYPAAARTGPHPQGLTQQAQP